LLLTPKDLEVDQMGEKISKLEKKEVILDP